MDIMDRVRSILDKKVYRVSTMSGDLAVLRPVDADGEDPILETLYDLDTFYRKEPVYSGGG